MKIRGYCDGRDWGEELLQNIEKFTNLYIYKNAKFEVAAEC